jgi:hypothetical protein
MLKKQEKRMFGVSNDTSAFHSGEFLEGCTAIIMMR